MLTAIVVAAGLAAGGPVDPPSDAEVLRALPKLKANDITIVKNKLADTVTPNLRLVSGGTVAVREQHWECVAYYTEAVTTDWLPVTVFVNKVQVVYIDTHQIVK